MDPQRALLKAIEYCDGKTTELARRMGGSVVRQNVEYWLRTARIPVEQCAAIERATGGTVRRWDLRPQDWHLIWPELIGAEGAPALVEAESRAA